MTTTPTRAEDKQCEAAFKRIMGDLSMPDDSSPDYDEWLFNKAWQASRAGGKSPYQDYTWEDVAMLVQENKILKESRAGGVVSLAVCIKAIRDLPADVKGGKSHAAVAEAVLDAAKVPYAE